MPESLPTLDPSVISSHYLTHSTSSLRTHYLSSGDPGNPLIILLHGFPETCFSWRRILPALASAGYFVVAPDMRGFGRTTGWDTRDHASADVHSFSMSMHMRDVLLLARGLGYTTVHCLVGHDAGAKVAALAALSRPDVYLRLVLLSHPYEGPPGNIPLGTHPSGTQEHSVPPPSQATDIHTDLAKLSPPRKHYKWYYASSSAAADLDPEAGLAEFLRGYFHLKSASWSGNSPAPLRSWTATELAKMPYYYIMPLSAGMRESVRLALLKHGGPADVDKSKAWLSDAELAVYVQEYARTGFQGALNWYRVSTDPELQRDLDVWAGMKMRQPVLMVLGEKDWGSYQQPGMVEGMAEVCEKFKGVRMVQGAGHWMQQEKPEDVIEGILGICEGEGGG